MGLLRRFKQEWLHSDGSSTPSSAAGSTASLAVPVPQISDDQASSVLAHSHPVLNVRHHKSDLAHESAATYSVLPQGYVCGDRKLDKQRLKQVQSVKSALENSIVHRVDDSSSSLSHKYGKMTETLGKGSYGLIRLVEGKKTYALKQLKVNAKEDTSKFVERILSEFVIGSCISHPYVTRVVDLLVTYDGPNVYFGQLLPYSNGADLFSYMKHSSDSSSDSLDCFIKQISQGLDYLHAKGISHCDLKLENVLVNYADPKNKDSDIRVTLSDFGKSQFCKSDWGFDDSSTSPLGSEPYMAPEEYGEQSYSTFKKDCWALGILIFAMYSLRNKSTHIYPWKSTSFKLKNGQRSYVDHTFGQYLKTTLAGTYDSNTKEWLIQKYGSFDLIEALFDRNDSDDDSSSLDDDNDDDEYNKLKKLFIYKLLDPKPSTRLTSEQFLDGDWMTQVDICIEYD